MEINRPTDKGKKLYTYEYPHAAMTADCVVFGFDGSQLQVLLIERGLEPFKGSWALPGGFMRIDETIEECALRELMEETGVELTYMDQFKVFSRVDRDPRERVVTVVFIALVRSLDYHPKGGDDAVRASWFDLDFLPPLAFDHLQIIRESKERLRELLRTRPVAFALVDKVFTADEVRKVYESVNGTSYDRRNFARKMMQTGIVEEVNPESDPMQISEAPLEESGLPENDVCLAKCNCEMSETFATTSAPMPEELSMRNQMLNDSIRRSRANRMISESTADYELTDRREKKQSASSAGKRKLRLFSFKRRKGDDDSSKESGNIKDILNF